MSPGRGSRDGFGRDCSRRFDRGRPLGLIELAPQFRLSGVELRDILRVAHLFAQCGKLLIDRIGSAAGIFNDVLCLHLGPLGCLGPFFLNLGIVLIGLFLGVLCGAAQLLCLLFRLFHLLALLIELCQDILKVLYIFVHKAACLLDNILPAVPTAGRWQRRWIFRESR